MRVVAITTFPPSTYAHSSFAYHTVQRFLESPKIDEIVILSDILNIREKERISDRLTVDRCWRYNSSLTLFDLIRTVISYQPDVIWISLHYTHFAKNPALVALSLLLPICLKQLGYPVITLLHNFLAVVNPRKMGIKLPESVARSIDKLLMKSIVSSDTVFTMVEAHEKYLRKHYPSAKIVFIEQDLYQRLPFHPLSIDTKIILTIGYYGTHKRLELLLDAFQIVKAQHPEAVLRIAGTSHLLRPNYLKEIMTGYAGRLIDVEFLGYVDDICTPSLFWGSSIVVAPTVENVGSSATLRYAAMYGRGIVIPRLGYFENFNSTEWGTGFYEEGNCSDLAATLCDILSDPIKQVNMAKMNYQRHINSQDTFVSEHLKVFEALFEAYRE